MSHAIAAHAHALVELDNYHSLQESLGEDTVDLVLEEFVARVRTVKRKGDGLFKVAANQYCLVWRGVSQRQHVNLAMAKLYRQFATPCEVLGESIPLVVHTGIALPRAKGAHASSSSHPAHPSQPGKRSTEAKQMLASAQAALRVAKTQQQPHVIFDDAQAQANQQDPAAALRLQEALDMGEFVVYFQPKVQANFHALVGAEALVRWHDVKRKKVISPAFFIEEIERSDLIWPLTLHVVKNAIAHCAQWPGDLGVAVNVPPKLLTGSRLVTGIADALAIAELEPQRFIVEVTERGSLPPQALETLAQLAALGIKIAIDDFGTGQASLLQFRDMPASIVKIDQSFVAAAGGSEKDQAIIRGVADLAHHCKMQVVAEGVEDAAAAELMKTLGCDWLQGYWFGKPVPHQEFCDTHLASLGYDEQGSGTDPNHALAVLDS